MTLIELLKLNLLNARKDTVPDELRINLLTVLVGDCLRIGKDAGNRETTDEECLKVIRSYVKACDTNIEIYSKAGLLVSTSKAINEKNILTAYLPPVMSPDAVYKAIQHYIAISGETGSFKGAMGYFKLNYAGQYDAKSLSVKLKEIFG